MELARETQNLREYRVELEAAEARLREAEADVFSLNQIVAGLEARIARLKNEADTPAESGEPEPPSGAAPQPRRKRRGLKKVLRAMMADGETRTVDEVLAALAEHESFRDDLPHRNSLVNRLWELVSEGYLESIDKGVYRRRTPQNGRVPEGLELAQT
jgi:multidrug resistance efflux pump